MSPLFINVIVGHSWMWKYKKWNIFCPNKELFSHQCYPKSFCDMLGLLSLLPSISVPFVLGWFLAMSRVSDSRCSAHCMICRKTRIISKPEWNESILVFFSSKLILLDLTKHQSLQISPKRSESENFKLTCFTETMKNLSQFGVKSYSVQWSHTKSWTLGCYDKSSVARCIFCLEFTGMLQHKKM